MEAMRNVGGTLLAETEHLSRLADKTIYRHACRYNSREDLGALHAHLDLLGAQANSGPYRGSWIEYAKDP